jgi:hypothetical protein
VLKKHLDALRAPELRDVYAFWSGEEGADLPRREAAERLLGLMSQEGVVHRRVRTLTRKVLDVLLLLLKRESYASDLPGLFRRLPGEEAVKLEYHDAEAGLKALQRRGFLAEVVDRSMATNGRVLYAVPEELGGMLISLFREETRTVGSVFSLAEHAASITASEAEVLARTFPGFASSDPAGAVTSALAAGGAPGLLERLDPVLREVVRHAVERHGGLMLRTEWQSRGDVLAEERWHQDEWTRALERSAVGTMARLSLAEYGIACDDEALVVFHEVLEDHLRRADPTEPGAEQVLRAGGDLVADLGAFLETVHAQHVKIGRDGEVYKAGRRRIQGGFVFRETVLAGPAEIWAQVLGAAEHLGLVGPDKEGFLELRPEADRFRALPLEQKTSDLYRVWLEQAGPGGRSLHQRETRTVVAEILREEPNRWWNGRSLAAVARHRYLASLDRRGIRDRHRDRFFASYFSGRETPRDLLEAIERHWLRQLYVLGMLDVAMREDRPVAWRLSALGARVLGAEVQGLTTGLAPLLVNPDFEVVVLPEGDVSDVVHTLDAFAQRVKTGEVVHFRLTKEALEAAVVAGRAVEDLLAFLESRSRGGVPQNVAYTLRGWAGSVSFATLERGVVLRAADEAALERILGVPELRDLVVRRLGASEVLLKDEPKDRRIRAALRDRGIHLQGP